jgi:hypothetical protein
MLGSGVAPMVGAGAAVMAGPALSFDFQLLASDLGYWRFFSGHLVEFS